MQHLKPTKKISVIRTFIRNSNIPEFIRKLFYPLVLRHRRFETGFECRAEYLPLIINIVVIGTVNQLLLRCKQTHTGWPKSYRKYILQITQPSQYRYAKLQHKYAVTSGSPSIFFYSFILWLLVRWCHVQAWFKFFSS